MSGTRPRLAEAAAAPDPAGILASLAAPVFVVDGEDRFVYVNPAAEQLFDASASNLLKRPLASALPEDSAIFALVRQVRQGANSVAQTGVTVELPRGGPRFVSIEAAPLAEAPAQVVVSLHERSIARKIDRQLVHRNAARSVTAMAALLAHEVKNPLSGIRGAAQLLEQNAGDEDRTLTRLICDETDRIVALVDRMEMFSDGPPLERAPVNIHEVLERVSAIAKSGFARGIRFVEVYDPSLPPVYGNRDLLVQALLNLVKNAAEAAPEDGVITLSTHYRQGVRLAIPGGGSRIDLPLAVSVEDNGPGIPEDLRPHLFDPFVTTKSGGKGLGLALVAKIVGDHGGVIEFDSQPGRTQFHLMLPVAKEEAGGR